MLCFDIILDFTVALHLQPVVLCPWLSLSQFVFDIRMSCISTLKFESIPES